MNAALITAIVGLLATLAAAWISHAAKISEFRHSWINGLRDDLATYFRALEAVHFCVGRLLKNTDPTKLDEIEQNKHDARSELLFAYRRILLRLNMKENLHRDLSEKLKEFWLIEERVPNQEQVEKGIELSQTVLKEEWEVAKRLPVPRTVARAFSAVVRILRVGCRSLRHRNPDA